MGRILKQKVKLIQEANRRLDEQDREYEVSGSDSDREYDISKQAEELGYSKGGTANVLNELREILALWENPPTPYESDIVRWESYHKDIKNLVEKLEKDL
jgi:hypothetical protein